MRYITIVILCVIAGSNVAGHVVQGAARAESAAVASNGFQLAFVDADVKRVVDAVLGEMLNLDYSIDAKVQGNITLRTKKPVSAEELVPLLEAALRPLDVVIIADGAAYRIVPRDNARANARFEAGGPGYATEIIGLTNASAAEMARVIEQFLGKEVVGGTDNPRNQIMITGNGEERAAAKALIAKFDVDALAQMNFEFRKLENVDPETLMAELENIFQPPLDIIGSRIKIVPLPRLRSILLIAADRADFAKVKPWIDRLDAGGSGKPKLYSYAVQNGLARDIAASLQAVLGTGGGATPSPAIADYADKEGASAPTGTLPSTASAVASIIRSSEIAISGGPRIVPNDANNNILIYATGEEYEFIKDLLEKIDRPVVQVLIEATLAEVTLSDDLRFGIDWRFLENGSTITLTGGTGSIPGAIFPGFSQVNGGPSARTVLNTLQSRTQVKILSSPRLMVLNNQTASLQVGDQVPLVTQQSQSVSAAGAPIVNSIELRDTGVILKVTPRVNENGTVILDVNQEVSDAISTTSSGISSPTIQQRKLSSTIATRSGQMVALGGLIRDRATREKSGFPLLSQIPLIGGVFGSHKSGGGRTELIVLLTPTVIRSPEELKFTMDDLIDHLDLARPLVDRAKLGQVRAHPDP